MTRGVSVDRSNPCACKKCSAGCECTSTSPTNCSDTDDIVNYVFDEIDEEDDAMFYNVLMNTHEALFYMNHMHVTHHTF